MFRPAHSLLFLLCILPSISLAADAISLADCIRLATERSERIERWGEEIQRVNAVYRQTIAAAYPQISLTVNQTLRDNSDFGRVSRGRIPTEDPATPIGGSGGSLGRSQLEGVISISQPLFTGFREQLISRALRHEGKAYAYDKRRDEELLSLDVALIFHQIGLSEVELKILSKTQKTLTERIEELKRFRDLGRARDGEVFAAEAELEEQRSLEAGTRGTLRATRELLAFLIGMPANDIKLAAAAPLVPLPTIDEYLTRAAHRADILALQERQSAQTERVTAARRESWPTLSLDGDGYLMEDPERNREWQALLRLSVPLFTGWRFEARRAEENAKLRSLQLTHAELQRLNERDVRVAFENLRAADEQRLSLQRLTVASEKNFASQRRDYELGIVSNLDVLQSIRQLQEAQQRLARATSLVTTRRIELEVTSGGPAA